MERSKLQKQEKRKDNDIRLGCSVRRSSRPGRSLPKSTEWSSLKTWGREGGVPSFPFFERGAALAQFDFAPQNARISTKFRPDFAPLNSDPILPQNSDMGGARLRSSKVDFRRGHLEYRGSDLS